MRLPDKAAYCLCERLGCLNQFHWTKVCSIYMQDLGASTLSRSLTKEDKVQAFFLHVYVSKSLVVRAWENVGDLRIRRGSVSDSAILPLSSCCQSCIRAVRVCGGLCMRVCNAGD